MKKKFYLLTGFVVLFLAACKPTPEEGSSTTTKSLQSKLL
jgi:hypothetical protein